MEKLAVIIPAAGSGSRMGARIPKPFIKLKGISILEHTIRAFAGTNNVHEIIVATSVEWKEEVETILSKFQEEVKILRVAQGGKERQDSIHNALQSMSEEIDIVAVHDAVRPFISEELIQKCCREALKVGGAIVAVPAKDTIKKIDDSQSITETPDRSNLWQAQTPQIFRKQLLLDAYKSAIESGFMGTDDASLVERIGGDVKVVEGDRRNLKITYPIDLKVAELILEERGAL
jgi:2-C-methyl-D-erythritol 4-phosphate cytidylyltransferase